ncbi:MAG: radical SAM protein [Pseudomonadota bacterium]|nr:radical SAM protein [Pseudomonadota bacterium]
MSAATFKYVYGPVPSRRLGRSLGVDLVPFKTCAYDCIYCHLGRTTEKTVERKEYVEIDAIGAELERKLGHGPAPDYIGLAGSGEPTLNLRIGDLIDRIKSRFRIPIAVFTNSALLGRIEVQDAILAADLVIPSLDSGDESTFQRVNRPHKDVSFPAMVDGIAAFVARFTGEVWLETLLIEGITDIPAATERLIAQIRKIRPTRVQLNTSSRPPAEEFARPLSRRRLEELQVLFPGAVDIIGPEKGNEHDQPESLPAGEGEVLELLSRRPCTVGDVARGLSMHETEALKLLLGLVATRKVYTTTALGHRFYAINRDDAG